MSYASHEISSAAVRVTTAPVTIDISDFLGNIVILNNQSNATPVQYEFGFGAVALRMYSAWPPAGTEEHKSPAVPPSGSISEDRVRHTHVTLQTPSGQAFVIIVDAESHTRR